MSIGPIGGGGGDFNRINQKTAAQEQQEVTNLESVEEQIEFLSSTIHLRVVFLFLPAERQAAIISAIEQRINTLSASAGDSDSRERKRWEDLLTRLKNIQKKD